MATSPVDAVKYAEEQLGVNVIFADVKDNRDDLDKVLTELSERRDNLRDLEYRLSDAEMEVASAERGKHADMSATAMTSHLKVVLQNTDSVRELREQIAGLKSAIEGLEYDKHFFDTNIRIGIARMTELGGYLQYLAVIKLVANKGGVPSVIALEPSEQAKNMLASLERLFTPLSALAANEASANKASEA